MATQAPNAAPLPLLYAGLDALNSGQHGKMKLRKIALGIVAALVVEVPRPPGGAIGD